MSEHVKVSGVYAICGRDNRVYIGMSRDIFKRQTVTFADALGWPWGIVQELPLVTSRKRRELHDAEHRVHKVFRERGFTVISKSVFEASAESAARRCHDHYVRLGHLGSKTSVEVRRAQKLLHQTILPLVGTAAKG